MLSTVWVSLLAATPATGVFFYVEGHSLHRVELEVAAAPSASGISELSPRTVAPLRLPGYVVAHAPGTHDHAGEDVAVVCRDAPTPTDEPRACDLFHVDRTGRVIPLWVRALSAVLLPGAARFAWWTDGMEVRARALAGGTETVLARGALEPRASADGRSLGLAVVPGLERFEPGFDACPARLSLDSGTLTRILGPCEAGAPFLSPSGEALYVSTHTGLASFFAQSGSTPAAQRTNVGRTELGPGFVPVAGRELVWLGASRAVFTASYADDVLWTLDLATGTALAVTFGREPAWVDAGHSRALVAVDTRSGTPRFLRLVLTPEAVR